MDMDLWNGMEWNEGRTLNGKNGMKRGWKWNG